MKVRLYTGSLKLVEKSGVGQALHHQQEMLRSIGVETTYKNDRDAVLVHINTVFPDSLFAALWARLRGQKVIYYGHSTMEDFRNSFKLSNVLAPIFKQWIKLCYETGNAIITPTEYSKRLLLSYGIKKPIYALSNGIDTDFFRSDPERRLAFRAKYQLGQQDKAVISVGHYIVRKGILDYIALARSMPEIRFFWFGYTNLNLIPAEVRDAIREAPANLAFPGYVGREELRDAYCGCDLFCFMSYEETEGIVVLEALSCGIPVLVRDIPVYEGWLQHGLNVYKGIDGESFHRHASDILEDRTAHLTKAGRQTAQERSIHTMGEKLLGIYQQVAKTVPTAEKK
ncbi:MAG: glycosyltransferase [Petrimonas sp.]|jgi:1,2-diacylglycerol-3-alpha-glucose alpha-1,2-glucosyltransferase|nr:glycosyltransferase [Petrimonas sp.]